MRAYGTEQTSEFELLEYIENPSAPELYADCLHDVRVIGSNAFFTLANVKRNSAGILYKETSFYARIPLIGVGPGLVLTARRTGTELIVPTVAGAVRSLMRH